MVIGGRDYTNFRNVRVRGTGSNAGILDVVDAAGTDSTLSIGTVDAGRAFTFPNRSGRFATSGSFAVDFPAIAATTFSFSTVVTVSGITAQDVITVTPNASMAANSTARILSGATPGAGSITLYFTNIGSAANGLYTQVFGYTAVRD